MFKVIINTRGETTFTMLEKFDQAKNFIDRYHQAMTNVGMTQGRDYDIELEVKS